MVTTNEARCAMAKVIGYRGIQKLDYFDDDEAKAWRAGCDERIADVTIGVHVFIGSSYPKPGDRVMLRSGKKATFIAANPDDAACLIGEELEREDGEILHFVTFELSDVVAINNLPKLPGSNDAANFIMPVITNGDDEVAKARKAAISRALSEGLGGLSAVQRAISFCPDFTY